MFKSISKAEFIRRMKIGTEWEFLDVSPNPIRPRLNQRIVLKTSRGQIVFLVGDRNSYLTFYAGDKCEANELGVLRITPGGNPKVTIQYTPVTKIDSGLPDK